jgi:hypothetical protein
VRATPKGTEAADLIQRPVGFVREGSDGSGRSDQ